MMTLNTLTRCNLFNLNQISWTHDWAQMTYDYPSDLGVHLLQHINEANTNANTEDLILPDVNTHTLNDDQKFAFHIVMNTLLQYISD